MIRQFSTSQTMQAFARLTWLQYQKTILYCAVGCGAAVFVTDIFLVLPHSGKFAFPEISPLALPIGLLAFMGLDNVAMKFGGMIDADDPMAAVRGTMAPMFTLPVATPLLVLGPLFVRAGILAAFWLAFCLFAAIPTHSDLPVILPTLLLILTVACAQASSWMIRTGGCAGVLFMFAGLFAPLVAALAVWLKVPQILLETASVGITAYAVSRTLRMAPLARCSHSTPALSRMSEKALAKDAARAAKLDVQTLSSPLKAQIWFRLKQRTHIIMPFMIGVMMLFMILLKVIVSSALPSLLSSGGIGLPLSSANFFSATFCLGSLFLVLFMPIDFQTAFRDGKVAFNSGIDPFTAIRPISTAILTLSKMTTAVIGGFYLSIVWILSSVLWFNTPGGPNLNFNHALASESALSRSLLIVALAACLPLVIASVQFFTATFGYLPETIKKLWKFTFPLVFGVVAAFLMIRLMPGTQIHDGSLNTEMEGFSRTELLTAGTFVLLVKISLAVVGAIRLQNKRLLDASITMRCLGIWGLTFAALTAIFYLLLPAGSIRLTDLAILIAVLLPANRLLWHILLFDKARHI